MGFWPLSGVRTVYRRAYFSSCTQFGALASTFPPRCRSRTVDPKKQHFYRPGEFGTRKRENDSTLDGTRRPFHCIHAALERDNFTELKAGHFFSARIAFPRSLANSVRGYPMFDSGALRAVYASHLHRSRDHGSVKKRPCLLYAKDYRTVTVLVCTSRRPAEYAHRFAPINYAPRLPGQPPAVLHSSDSPESRGAGYIFFTHAIVARLIEKHRRFGRHARGPGGIVINDWDRETGDSWVPKTDYRLSTDQLAYIEELNMNFWEGIRYDEYGAKILGVRMRRSMIRRVGNENILAEASQKPPMTARERGVALEKARRAIRISDKRRRARMAHYAKRQKISARELLEARKAYESEGLRRHSRRRESRGRMGDKPIGAPDRRLKEVGGEEPSTDISAKKAKKLPRQEKKRQQRSTAKSEFPVKHKNRKEKVRTVENVVGMGEPAKEVAVRKKKSIGVSKAERTYTPTGLTSKKKKLAGRRTNMSDKLTTFKRAGSTKIRRVMTDWLKTSEHEKMPTGSDFPGGRVASTTGTVGSRAVWAKNIKAKSTERTIIKRKSQGLSRKVDGNEDHSGGTLRSKEARMSDVIKLLGSKKKKKDLEMVPRKCE